MRWGVEKRLEFIEFRLFWEGGINRSDIINRFGISIPQASKDLTLYDKEASGNMIYDKSAKRYQASEFFKPVFIQPSAGIYLAQLREETDTGQASPDTWLNTVPAHAILPIPRRHVNEGVLRNILKAIREQKSLEIFYQSMSANRPGPEWRRITPHAFGSDGLRWHVRAFCHIDLKFKDFILSRISGSRNLDIPGLASTGDTIWHEQFAVSLIPNPALSESQREIIAEDYLMKEGYVEVLVRKALLYYFQMRLRLNLVGIADSPHETPIVIENRVAFDRALAEAMA